jgi:hypothetical protein
MLRVAVVPGASGSPRYSLLSLANGVAASGAELVDPESYENGEEGADVVVRLNRPAPGREREVPLVMSHGLALPSGVPVVCNSEWVAQSLIGPLEEDRHVLHSIVEDVYAGGAAEGGRTAIGFVGGLESLVRGSALVEKLVARHPEWEFSIADGTIPDGGMADYYAGLRVLILPAVSEAYGRVVVEAASAGVPAIATDLPGIRETLCVAQYIPPEDAQDVEAWESELSKWMALDDLQLSGPQEIARIRYEAVRSRQDEELAALMVVLEGVGSTAPPRIEHVGVMTRSMHARTTNAPEAPRTGAGRAREEGVPRSPGRVERDPGAAADGSFPERQGPPGRLRREDRRRDMERRRELRSRRHPDAR